MPGPISAFFCTTVCTTSSAGPIWATVRGPDSGDADARRMMGRGFTGSNAEGAPKIGCGVTVRVPSLKTTSNRISRGMTRPSDVPMT